MKTFRSHTWALYPFVLMLLTVPASAGVITLRFDDWIGSSYSCRGGCADNPELMTYPGSSELQWLGGAYGDYLEFWYSFPTFTVPAGQAIFSAKLKLSFATVLQSTYEPSLLQVLPVDPDLPFRPGRMQVTAKTENSVISVLGYECGFESLNNFQGFDLMHQWCDPVRDGTLSVSLFGVSVTNLTPAVIDPGFNASSAFDISGGNSSPISGELEIVYTPEPLSLALIGSGMVLVAGMARQRGIHGKTATNK